MDWFILHPHPNRTGKGGESGEHAELTMLNSHAELNLTVAVSVLYESLYFFLIHYFLL